MDKIRRKKGRGIIVKVDFDSRDYSSIRNGSYA